jgi:O-antigen/teichoic acid export membrane protein
VKRLLGIVKSQTIKDSLVVFLGLAVTAGLGFVYTVIMARTLRPESYGVFAAISSLVAIVYSIGDLGVGPAIINFLPKHKKNEAILIASTFWFQNAVGFVLTISFWLLARYANLLIPGSLPEHFILVGSLAFNYILVGWSQAVFTAEKNFFRLSLSQIIDATIKIVIVLWLFRVGQLSISTALIANCVSALFALMITYWRKLLVIDLSFDKKLFTGIYHYSKWIAVSRFFSVFFSRIDILLLNLLASSYSAGIYAAASRITLLFAMVVAALGSVVNPRFSAFKTKHEAISYIKKLTILITGVALAVLLCVFSAKFIILTVFGTGFSDSVVVFQFLAVSMIPFLYSVIFTATILYTFHQTWFYALITFLQLLTVIIINLIFIPTIGVYAPVLASAVSNILVFCLSVVKLKGLFRNEKISLS